MITIEIHFEGGFPKQYRRFDGTLEEAKTTYVGKIIDVGHGVFIGQDWDESFVKKLRVSRVVYPN